MTTNLYTNVFAWVLLSAPFDVVLTSPRGCALRCRKASQSDRDMGQREGLQERCFSSGKKLRGRADEFVPRSGRTVVRRNCIAADSAQKVRIVGQEYECTFYPVMRQIYKLKSGNTFTLYTFRFP